MSDANPQQANYNWGRSELIEYVNADGKTLTAMNLSLILSESYKRRVLLIDGDLRRPTISVATNLSHVEGLSEVIHAADERRVPLVQLTEPSAAAGDLRSHLGDHRLPSRLHVY